MKREYRCHAKIVYTDSWNNKPYSWSRDIIQKYLAEDAANAASQFIDLLHNHMGYRNADIKNIEVYVVATEEKVSLDLLKK